MGPTGLAAECRGGGGDLRVGLSAGALSTDIVFPNSTLRLTEQSLSASLGYRLSPRLTLLAGGGALLAGSLGGEALGVGGLAFVGVSGQALRGGGGVPFVSISVVASVLHAHPVQSALTSVDLKVSATAAWPLWGRLAPYLGVALFGGPVWYGGQTGTDHDHYQALAGVSLALPLGLDAYVEGSPLGERELSGGLGFTY